MSEVLTYKYACRSFAFNYSNIFRRIFILPIENRHELSGQLNIWQNIAHNTFSHNTTQKDCKSDKYIFVEKFKIYVCLTWG